MLVLMRARICMAMSIAAAYRPRPHADHVPRRAAQGREQGRLEGDRQGGRGHRRGAPRRAPQPLSFTVTVILPPHEPTRPVLQPPRNPLARNPSFDAPFGTRMLVLNTSVWSPASMRWLVASTLP